MNRPATSRTLDTRTFALVTAVAVGVLLVWSARWMALFQLSAGNAPAVFWTSYVVMAAALFGWGAHRLTAARGRADGVTWWLLAAPLTLIAAPLAAGAWLGYILIERRSASRAHPTADRPLEAVHRS
jgi:hypothetical protein